MSYRDEIEALKAKKEALDSEIASMKRERDEAERLLDEIHAKKSLPVLPNLYIAAPCPAEWANMVGDERVRFCGQCEKNVFNLSDMTRVEAEALIREKEGKLCVRYYQRKDGTVLTKDCPVGVQRRRRRRFFAASAALLIGAAAMADRLRSPAEPATVDDPCVISRSAFPPEVESPTPSPSPFPPEVRAPKKPPRSSHVAGGPRFREPHLMGDIAVMPGTRE